jgi:hypothetical protein
MKQKKSWELTDEFWEAVQDLLVRIQKVCLRNYNHEPYFLSKVRDAMRLNSSASQHTL